MVVYSKEILDHHQNPRNRGVLEGANRKAKEESPLCGCTDWVELFLKVKDDKVEDAKFQGEGCIISMATASMLTEQVKGKSTSEVGKINEDEIRQTFGDSLTSFREKCAFLSLQALRSALGLKDKR
jgi:nitrogen fixation NifU-like protein